MNRHLPRPDLSHVAAEIAAAAARLVVEDGMEYGPAKHQALQLLGLPGRTPLPGNDLLEAEVRDYIALFCPSTQALDLQALRALALVWMLRLQAFRPHVGGAVWRGTATRRNDIYLQLFCDDSKSAEIALIDQRVAYDVQTVTGFTGDTVDALSIQDFCAELAQNVSVHLMIYDYDDLKGALRKDSQGAALRGDAVALQRLLDTTHLLAKSTP